MYASVPPGVMATLSGMKLTGKSPVFGSTAAVVPDSDNLTIALPVVTRPNVPMVPLPPIARSWGIAALPRLWASGWSLLLRRLIARSMTLTNPPEASEVVMTTNLLSGVTAIPLAETPASGTLCARAVCGEPTKLNVMKLSSDANA